MLTALIVLAVTSTAAVLCLLALVAAAIRWEAPATRLANRPAGPITAIVRRLLGVYVSRPDPTATGTERHPGACLMERPTSRHDEGW